MKWLLWKEYRQNRGIVFLLLFLLIVPHLPLLVAFLGRCITWRFDEFPWRLGLFGGSVYGFFLSQLIVPALIGGNIIAGERGDRSAEFQVCLPVTRSKILSAKLLLVLMIGAAIWLINPPILYGVMRSDLNADEVRILLPLLCNAAATGFAFFCVTWLFSSIVTNPTIAIVAGSIVPLFVAGSVVFVECFLGTPMSAALVTKTIGVWYCGICLALCPICFVAGAWFYLRRVEP